MSISHRLYILELTNLQMLIYRKFISFFNVDILPYIKLYTFNSTTVLKIFCLTSVNFGQNGLNIVSLKFRTHNTYITIPISKIYYI